MTAEANLVTSWCRTVIAGATIVSPHKLTDAEVDAVVTDTLQDVMGNRPGEYKLTPEDMALLFEGILKRALKLVRGQNPV